MVISIKMYTNKKMHSEIKAKEFCGDVTWYEFWEMFSKLLLIITIWRFTFEHNVTLKSDQNGENIRVVSHEI